MVDPSLIYFPDLVPHPGDTVLDYLESHGWSQSDLARRTGLTPKTISEICGGKAPITPSTALALEKTFQRPAHLWLNLQRIHDEAVARKRARERASTWKEWTKKFPLAEMRKLGWLEAQADLPETDALLSFFAVSSPSSWDSVWGHQRVAYRQTRRGAISEEAMFAWLRAIEIDAQRMTNLGTFDEGRVRALIPDLRKLTTGRAEEASEPVRALCAPAGVAVVWERELKHTGISGCARWLGTTGLIGLTLRYKTDDQMWFTLFHELAHLLLHRRSRPFVLDNAERNLSDGVVDPEMQQCEDEANRFAADTLIPPALLAEFIKSGKFDNNDIYDFAERVGVSPGILVGRLQFEKILKIHQGNALKQKLGWSEGDPM